ncbi:unnamed protein product, partial [marine sediment metagenome]
VGELDVAKVAVREKRSQGAIPQTLRFQRTTPSHFHLTVADKGLETVKRFSLAIVSHVKDVQMDV